ncbi:hypothetical protein C8R45DRAFT_920324 [Mycena sanguinolenta]|nr:hypothetical protein C8R45DRAFT_920324 [Mycena sanguinolenta]
MDDGMYGEESSRCLRLGFLYYRALPRMSLVLPLDLPVNEGQAHRLAPTPALLDLKRARDRLHEVDVSQPLFSPPIPASLLQYPLLGSPLPLARAQVLLRCAPSTGRQAREIGRWAAASRERIGCNPRHPGFFIHSMSHVIRRRAVTVASAARALVWPNRYPGTGTNPCLEFGVTDKFALKIAPLSRIEPQCLYNSAATPTVHSAYLRLGLTLRKNGTLECGRVYRGRGCKGGRAGRREWMEVQGSKGDVDEKGIENLRALGGGIQDAGSTSPWCRRWIREIREPRATKNLRADEEVSEIAGGDTTSYFVPESPILLDWDLSFSLCPAPRLEPSTSHPSLCCIGRRIRDVLPCRCRESEILFGFIRDEFHLFKAALRSNPLTTHLWLRGDSSAPQSSIPFCAYSSAPRCAVRSLPDADSWIRRVRWVWTSVHPRESVVIRVVLRSVSMGIVYPLHTDTEFRFQAAFILSIHKPRLRSPKETRFTSRAIVVD